MIKFNIGKISVYLLIYALSWIIIIFIILFGHILFKEFFSINMYINQIGQIIGGLSIYLYQYRAFYKNENVKYFGLELIHNKANIKQKDKPFKIIILIFFSSIFDFFIIIIEYHFFVEINGKIPLLFKFRIAGIITIVSSLLCACSLNFKFGKHHKFSLIFMSAILIINIILEIFLRTSNISIKQFLLELFLKILRNIIISFIDCIEKYLYEVNYVNPFKLLIIEGILKLIFLIIFTVCKKIIKIEQLKKNFTENTPGTICGLIFLLLGDLFFSAILRVYQIYCVVIHSPMIKSLADYIFAPIFNILFFIEKQEFYDSIVYFVICEILSIIMGFFGCVYNEFIVLFCCGLEHNTKFDISSRAELPINNPNKFLLDDIQNERNSSEIELSSDNNLI